MILAFDVIVEREAQLIWAEIGIRIFAADVIYTGSIASRSIRMS